MNYYSSDYSFSLGVHACRRSFCFLFLSFSSFQKTISVYSTCNLRVAGPYWIECLYFLSVTWATAGVSPRTLPCRLLILRSEQIIIVLFIFIFFSPNVGILRFRFIYFTKRTLRANKNDRKFFKSCQISIIYLLNVKSNLNWMSKNYHDCQK